MALPPEVRKTIHAIDEKIKALEDTKKHLMETFGAPVSVTARTNGNRLVAEVTHVVPSSTTATKSGDKLVAFLRAHGPATRREILESSGVPDGSISYLLKNGRFRRREDDKWEAIA